MIPKVMCHNRRFGFKTKPSCISSEMLKLKQFKHATNIYIAFVINRPQMVQRRQKFTEWAHEPPAEKLF